jgi:hypothetical protein
MDLTGRSDDERQARLNEILADYMEQLDRGAAVDRGRLLAAHPDLADELRQFFDTSDEIDRLAAHSRAAGETAQRAAMPSDGPGGLARPPPAGGKPRAGY